MHDAGETKAAPRRIRFTPPTEMFTLCHYTASGLKGPPIKAMYDMKVTRPTATSASLLLLNEDITHLMF